MEECKHFNKTIYNHDELDVDDIRFEVISDITHHFRISKKTIYVVDLREVENFFYDGTWFYVYISEKMMLYDHQRALENKDPDSEDETIRQLSNNKVKVNKKPKKATTKKVKKNGNNRKQHNSSK